MEEVHNLVVPEDPEDELTVDHPSSCPVKQHMELVSGEYTMTAQYDCRLQKLVDNDGLSYWFQHTDSTATPHGQQIVVEAGTHPIRYVEDIDLDPETGIGEDDSYLELIDEDDEEDT